MLKKMIRQVQWLDQGSGELLRTGHWARTGDLIKVKKIQRVIFNKVEQNGVLFCFHGSEKIRYFLEKEVEGAMEDYPSATVPYIKSHRGEHAATSPIKG